MLSRSGKTTNNERDNTALTFVFLLIWVAILIICIINRDKFTLQSIVARSPSSTALAILVLWALFALKSVSIVIYCGILYAASGILFPLYFAIPVTIVGTGIMITIPFLIGKKYGYQRVNVLFTKHPKLRAFHETRSDNDFLFSLIIRIAGLPSDPISMYMGATSTHYLSYLLGSLLAMLPGAIAITVMGTSITDVGSPIFITALIFHVSITIISGVFFMVYSKRRNQQNA